MSPNSKLKAASPFKVVSEKIMNHFNHREKNLAVSYY